MGFYRFELQGADKKGQRSKLAIALKANGSTQKEPYTPLCGLVGKAGPVESVLKHFIPISCNFKHY